MKETRLSSRSLNARAVRYFLFRDELPKSICDYVPLVVITWVFFIPIFILTIPARILGHFSGKTDGFWTNLAISFILYLLISITLFAVSLMVGSLIELINFFNGDIKEISKDGVGGICLWIIAVGSAICIWILEKRKEIRINDFIIVRYMKSIKEKNCIKINWED